MLNTPNTMDNYQTYHYSRVMLACEPCMDHTFGDPATDPRRADLVARFPHRITLNGFEGFGDRSCFVCGSRAHGPRYSVDLERKA